MTPAEFIPNALGAIFLTSLAFVLSRLLQKGPPEDPAARRAALQAFANAHGFEFHPEANYLLQSRFPPTLRLLGDRREHAQNILLRTDKATGNETAILDFDFRVARANADLDNMIIGNDERTEFDSVFGFRFRGRMLAPLPKDQKLPNGWLAWTAEEWLFLLRARVPMLPPKGPALAQALATAQRLRVELIGDHASARPAPRDR